jgi:hypothetical protein
VATIPKHWPGSSGACLHDPGSGEHTGLAGGWCDGHAARVHDAVREWQGRTWTVEVIDGGFLMGGEKYASLSAIARKITGSRWSGPRFFGLTEQIRQEATPTKTSHHGKAA